MKLRIAMIYILIWLLGRAFGEYE